MDFYSWPLRAASSEASCLPERHRLAASAYRTEPDHFAGSVSPAGPVYSAESVYFAGTMLPVVPDGFAGHALPVLYHTDFPAQRKDSAAAVIAVAVVAAAAMSEAAAGIEIAVAATAAVAVEPVADSASAYSVVASVNLVNQKY